ncbi:hypothetical protein WAK64_04820 [Bacillus spongiae]|uniref:DUF4203 domain-containing protein n=1 Tax=Bacillus spongiae TaxID=2683610 RepID=A0ABU8HAN7_9BACI
MEMEIVIITGLIFLLILATIAIISLVLSFKKENRICCIGGGVALAVVSSSLGFFAASSAIFVGSDEFVEIVNIIALAVLFLIALLVSGFTLLSVVKKKEFCCLGGGFALAGIGYGASVIFIVSLEEFNLLLFILWVMILLTISITAFLVILMSLKKCQSGLCCFAGAIALAGVALGLGSFFAAGTAFNGQFTNITLLFILMGVLLVVFTGTSHKKDI